MKIKDNFHTHIYLCKHATGNAEDYIKRAIELNYESIGISDHGPLTEYFLNKFVTYNILLFSANLPCNTGRLEKNSLSFFCGKTL